MKNNLILNLLTAFALSASSLHGAASEAQYQAKKTSQNTVRSLQDSALKILTKDIMLELPLETVREVDIWTAIANRKVLHSLADDLYHSIASQIAHDVYLKVSKNQLNRTGSTEKRLSTYDAFHQLSPFLQPHFRGVSIQDLLDNNLLPAIRTTQRTPLGSSKLSLPRRFICDLAGLENVPGIASLDSLILDNNNLSTIAPNAFTGLNLLDLSLSRNKLKTFDPSVLKGLTRLKSLALDNNELDASEQKRICTHLHDSISPSVAVSFTSRVFYVYQGNGFFSLPFQG